MGPKYDTIVIGSGPAGLMSAIFASDKKRKILIVEKMKKPSLKLLSTGNGSCNITNNSSNDEFIEKFGHGYSTGRFTSPALNFFSKNELIQFFEALNLKIETEDGFRYFPKSHKSSSVLNCLLRKLEDLNVDILYNSKVNKIFTKNSKIDSIQIENKRFETTNVILACGGLGYPLLGGSSSGYELAKQVGHSITELNPGMVRLETLEKWTSKCKADTLPKVTLQVNIPKYKKYKQTGDLIFTDKGIMGPVVLDLSRDLTPLIKSIGNVPISIKPAKIKDKNSWVKIFKQWKIDKSGTKIINLISIYFPNSISKVLLDILNIPHQVKFKDISAKSRDELANIFLNIPLTITGSEGFDKAMVTRGGIKLKEINPNTLESKIVKNLYFCGELIDIDGPCGGYNLQWAFSSGALAGKSIKTMAT